MNYTPNAIQWRKGDIVIHDADAKQPHMLMRVTGYDRDGLVISEYVDRTHRRKTYRNELRFLHDPALFGIDAAPALEQPSSARATVKLCPQCDQPRQISANGTALRFCEEHMKEHWKAQRTPKARPPKQGLTTCFKCGQPRMIDSKGRTLTYCVEHQREIWRATADRRAIKKGNEPVRRPRVTPTIEEMPTASNVERYVAKEEPFVILDEAAGKVWVVTAVLSYRNTDKRALNEHTLRLVQYKGVRVIRVASDESASEAHTNG